MTDLEDGVFIVVHSLDEAFDERTDLLPSGDGAFVHSLYIMSQIDNQFIC